MRKKTGSIVPHGDRWRGFFTADDGSRVSRVCNTLREARVWVKSGVDTTKGFETTPDEMTVEKWVDQWLTAREKAKRIRDTRSDRNRFETHIKGKPIASLRLRAVSRRQVLDWLDIVRSTVKVQTARNILTVLRGALQSAYDTGRIKQNPALGIRIKSPARTEETWTVLTPKEIGKFVRMFPEPERYIVAFAIGTGLRAGELCALRREDVGEDAIVVRYGKPPDLPTKSGKPRIVPLFGIALEAWKHWQESEGPNPHGLAFPRKFGGYRNHLHVVCTHAEWKATREKFGRHIRWHDLRHTCASTLVSGGWGRKWTLREVQEMLGHSTIAVTERYAHFAGSALLAAAAETQSHIKRTLLRRAKPKKRAESA